MSCYHGCHCRRYGCLNFLADVFMVLLSHGLWFIWIIIRENRRHTC